MNIRECNVWHQNMRAKRKRCQREISKMHLLEIYDWETRKCIVPLILPASAGYTVVLFLSSIGISFLNPPATTVMSGINLVDGLFRGVCIWKEGICFFPSVTSSGFPFTERKEMERVNVRMNKSRTSESFKKQLVKSLCDKFLGKRNEETNIINKGSCMLHEFRVTNSQHPDTF